MRGRAGRVVVAVTLVAAVAVVVGVGVYVRRLLTEAPRAEGPPVEFVVAPGESFRSVASRLEADGFVVSARRLRVLARLTGADRVVRAGTYVVERGQSPLHLLDEMVQGHVVQRRITVPEGWRAGQVAEAVRDSLGIPPEEFRDAVTDPKRIRRVGARGGSVEGYLFPDTYLFPDGVTAGAVVDAMIDRFEEVWRTIPAAVPEGYDRHDMVTLASIVEAETPLASEKPRVAAVYWNRLRHGWLLQADPTVRYGLDYRAERLYYKQLGIDTPYNTYMHAGLPPGPIDSPGRDALLAVLAPLQPCEDFYFVASGRGGHVFSRTKAEHDRAIRAARSPSAG